MVGFGKPESGFMASRMEITTVGELLHWSYANLAMAHAAVTAKAEKYGRMHFIIRSRLYCGLRKQTMQIGPLADDERLKMVLPQACCYCGSREFLAADHLIPRKRGGANTGDNLVWACRACNSSKCARDALEWLAERNQFPPVLLLRRYLKLAIEMCQERKLMEAPLGNAHELPFALLAIPKVFPQPSQLRLWITELPNCKETHYG
ncbi:MAG: HNH endonuclease [Phycisphaerae bacterium]